MLPRPQARAHFYQSFAAVRMFRPSGVRNMNNVPTCLLAVLLCAATSLAQRANHADEARSGVAAQAAARERVELTTAITRRRSCLPYTLELALKLRFRNSGEAPVILSKKALLGRIIVSRSPEDAAAGKHMQSLRYTDHPGQDEPGFGSDAPPDLTNFVVLRPGEVYESEESVPLMTYIPGANGPRPLPEIDFSSGTYFLQIGVLTWPYVADPGPIRGEWKDKGSLWTQGLLSAPMPFTTDKDEPLAECPPAE